ncbi:hypothetical protein [Streptomyces sp. NPDC058412]|uniref:hypothetical protein n=1 Tax=Streptomyces sp. NPDC058412 TaxID=3346486 RepID=UPI00364BD64B
MRHTGNGGAPATGRFPSACGWRGPAQYLLDWDTIGDQPRYEAGVDPTGPVADWPAHPSVARDPTVLLLLLLLPPLPLPLAALRTAGVGVRWGDAERVGRGP